MSSGIDACACLLRNTTGQQSELDLELQSLTTLPSLPSCHVVESILFVLTQRPDSMTQLDELGIAIISKQISSLASTTNVQGADHVQHINNVAGVLTPQA